MLNMMRLDLLGTKSFWVRIALTMLVPFALLLSDQLYFVIFIMAYFMMDAVYLIFQAEEKGDLNLLYMTLPLTRRIIVASRFVLAVAAMFLGLILGILLMYIGSALLYGRTIIFQHSFVPSFDMVVLTACVTIVYCAIVNLFTMPTLLKMGFARGKVIGFYGPALAMYGVIVIYVIAILNSDAVFDFTMSTSAWITGNIALSSSILLSIAALFFAASYLLSQRVFERRDF